MSEEVFQKKFNEYYRLKEQYYTQLKNSQKKIKDKNISDEQKKEEIKSLKIKCVNCGRKGGTIFSENNRTIKAICGVAPEPCELNIEIFIGKKENISDLINELEILLEEIKEQIIKLKLDLVYNYKSQEEIVTEFSDLKKKYVSLQKMLDSLIEKKKKIFDTERKNLVAMELNKQLDGIVNMLQNKIQNYKETNDITLITDSITIYNETLSEIISNISQNKYERQYVQKLDNQYKLIQNEISYDRNFISLLNEEKSKVIS